MASIGAALLLRDLLRLFFLVVAIAETSYWLYHNRIFSSRHPFSTHCRNFSARYPADISAARSVRLGGASPVFLLRAAAIRSPKGVRDILFRKRPRLPLSETLLSVNRGNRVDLTPEKYSYPDGKSPAYTGL